MRANTAHPVHEIIATRRSPRSLAPEAALSDIEIISILEAARWAPSAFNGQPWRFFLGKNGDATFTQTLSSLEPFNQGWAKNASVLILVAAKTTRDDGSIHADFQYDTALAVAQMVFEVHNLGYVAHQMTGFNRENAQNSLEIPSDLVPVVVVAIGKQDHPDKLAPALAEREVASRTRKPLTEIVLRGLPA